MDDLSDVVLEGRRLIGDDPKRWLIPPAASAHDDLLQWWQSLIEMEDRKSQLTLDANTKATLLWLTNLYEELVSMNVNTAPQQSKIRSVVRSVCRLGLTTEQAGRLLNIPQPAVYTALYCNQQMWPQDISARIAAERMLRDGKHVAEVARSCRLDSGQVKTLADMLGIERSSENPYAKPKELRERAIEYRRQGYDNHWISATFAAEGHNVPAGTISQWWRRYGQGAA